jgi:hypothetical protein
VSNPRPFISYKSRPDTLSRLAALRQQVVSNTIRDLISSNLLAKLHIKLDGKNGGGDGVAGTDKKDGGKDGGKDGKEKDGKETKEGKESKDGKESGGEAGKFTEADPGDFFVRYGDPTRLDRGAMRVVESFQAERLKQLIAARPTF